MNEHGQWQWQEEGSPWRKKSARSLISFNTRARGNPKNKCNFAAEKKNETIKKTI